MQIDNLSWFPGHMTKTKRMISAEIKNMDAVCEIVDARIPMSSRNPDVDELTAGKPRLIVLNRADQADPAETRRWTQYFRTQGCAVLEANAKNGVGTEKFSAAVRELLRDKLAAAAAEAAPDHVGPYNSRGQRPGGQGGPCHGPGCPQCGQVHLYQ